MPRPKNNRDLKRDAELAAREQKQEEFQMELAESLYTLHLKGKELIKDVENQMEMLLLRTSKSVLKMRMSEFLALKLDSFNDWTPNAAAELVKSKSSKASKTSDEGYRTEDKHNTGDLSDGSSKLQLLFERQPKPFSACHNRSASANTPRQCGSNRKPSPNGSGVHTSRGKLRTPMTKRMMALSADRTPVQSPAVTLFRLPKPGELALSTRGTPLLVQAQSDTCSTVNIPVENGVISMRPKELSEMNCQLFNPIKLQTLNEMRVLRDNLNKIMTTVDREK